MSDYLPNPRMMNGEDEQELDNGASWLQSIGSAHTGPLLDPFTPGASTSDYASPSPNPMTGAVFWQGQPNDSNEPSPAYPPTSYWPELQTDRPIYPYTPEEIENWKITTKPQKLTLEAVFQRNISPDASSRAQLADELGITTRQVQVWFQNRRARARAKERKADIAPPPRDSVGDSTIPLSSSDQDASPFIPRLIVHNEILDAAIPPDASQPYSKSDPEEAASTIAIIVTRLTTIFNDVALYKKLLSSRDSDAQQLLDLFQWLLDAPAVDSVIRRSLIVAMQRLSRKTGLYPACYSLQGVEYGGDPVAAGSYADIYKGTMGDQPVCMKVIRVYQTTQVGHFLKACSKEAILWGQLSHANLLPIYGLYRLNTRICLVSSWMEHGVITQYLANYPDADRLLLVLDVTQGLAYLHENKIIHGDLKGVNILVSKSGRACVADFGLSSISDANILAWTSNSSAASKGGSMRWQAPELFDLDNDELVQNDEASDMYAWACVCYEIFTGNVPFSHLSRESAVLLQVQAGRRPPRPLKSSPPWLTWGLREDMWSLMDDCWNGDSTKRPTVQNVLARLEPMLPRDRRPADSGEMLTPAQFRETMRAPLDVRSILETLKQVSNPP